MPTRIGRYTIRLDSTPSVIGFASVVGKKEGEGPLADWFDLVEEDSLFGEKTWEKAESRMQAMAFHLALQKANISRDAIDLIFAGDLLNQCIGSGYGHRGSQIPFAGLFGACSTMAESLALAAAFVDSGLAATTAAVTSSHFCTAERQFRYPLEYGGQRPPSAQWTVTGSGCTIISHAEAGPFIREITFGMINDLGISDINNMGAAMAPAAADTLLNYLHDTGANPAAFDMIVTGDLGQVGAELFVSLLKKENVLLPDNHRDCGMMIFDQLAQDVHSGGSGCGCSASVLCSAILGGVVKGSLKEVLFIATGALMSPLSVQQGETIPSIAHLIHLSSKREGQ